jgi:hypothetical protein
MKRIFIVFLLMGNLCHAQGFFQIGVLGGGSGYAGDLTDNSVSIKTIRPAGGVELRYILSDYFAIRGGVNYSRVGAKDSQSGDSVLIARNLSFETNILEVNACGELNLLSPELFNVYPYVFAGLGYFHFNPYTYDNSGKKVFLRPLSTEGEGLPQYPNRKMYSLNQICIPMGAGFKWTLSDDLSMGFEVGARKLFTDYLDDVSGRYAAYNYLLTDKGIEAVSLAYRGTGPYPNGGSIRGDSKKKDMYYTFGLNVFYSFGNEEARARYGSPNRLY